MINYMQQYLIVYPGLQPWGNGEQGGLFKSPYNIGYRTSLVAQWLRICLPMQGTWVRSLAREDHTCHGATKPMCYKYWACALEAASHNYWSPHAYSPCSATREATALRSPSTARKSSPRSPQLEKACAQQRRPNSTKKKFLKSLCGI